MRTRLRSKILDDAVAFRVILVLFFLWGFLTALNDILVPHFKAAFVLTYAQAVLIPATFFSTCFVCAPIAALLAGRMGYRRGMAIGLLLMGLGALLFIPAAFVAQFSSFLAALAVLGAGITILQASGTPYVAFLGKPENAPARFSLALGFNSLGTMLAPLFGGWLILRGPADATAEFLLPPGTLRQQAMNSVRGPYLFLGGMLIALAAAVVILGLPEMRTAPPPPPAGARVKSVFRHKPLIFGAITAFLYAGAEISIGSFLISYLSLPSILGVSHRVAALLVPIYWGGAVVGRFFGWHLLQHHRPETILLCIASVACLLIVIAVLSNNILAAAALLAVGFCNALVVPIVVMLAISGLGPLTARASSLMTAANIGAGIIPFVLGILADRIGLHHALILPVLSYAFIIFYALRGSHGHLLGAPAIE